MLSILRRLLRSLIPVLQCAPQPCKNAFNNMALKEVFKITTVCMLRSRRIHCDARLAPVRFHYTGSRCDGTSPPSVTYQRAFGADICYDATASAPRGHHVHLRDVR